MEAFGNKDNKALFKVTTDLPKIYSREKVMEALKMWYYLEQELMLKLSQLKLTYSPPMLAQF